MFLDENTLLIAGIYGAIIVIVFWIALIVWAYRDMRSRSRDRLSAIFSGVLVAVLNIPGVFAYILLRPRETLSEAYERSLEEEALLQEIEEKPACPGCGQRIQNDWQACPYCHTRLKKVCYSCDHLLDLSWDICPYCAATQSQYRATDDASSKQHVQRTVSRPPAVSEKWLNPQAQPPVSNSDPTSPRYIEEDY